MALPHAETNSLQRHRSSRLLLSSQIGEKINVREPQRSYALNAIDRAIKFWKGRAVPRPRPLRAPWLLAPDWRQHLKKPLSQYVPLMHHFPQIPKEMASCWAHTKKPTCHCTPLRPYLSLLLAPPDTDNHLALNGDPLLFPEQPLHSIANDPYRTRSAHPRETHHLFQQAFQQWTKRSSLPSVSQLLLKEFFDHHWTQHSIHVTSVNMTYRHVLNFHKPKLFPGSIFHSEGKRATSLRRKMQEAFIAPFNLHEANDGLFQTCVARCCKARSYVCKPSWGLDIFQRLSAMSWVTSKAGRHARLKGLERSDQKLPKNRCLIDTVCLRLIASCDTSSLHQ